MGRKKDIFYLIVILASIAVIYISIYSFKIFSYSEFGTIGDSVGGIVTPILTLIAAYFAYQAYSKEKEVAIEAKKQTQIQEKNFILIQDQYNQQKKKEEEAKSKESVQNMIDDIADTYQFLEDRILGLQYNDKDGSHNEGTIAIEKLFSDLRNKDYASSLMYLQILKSLEACNEIFIYSYEITIAFHENERQRRLLIWELVLLYKSYFASGYEVYKLDEIFTTSIKVINDLRDSRSNTDPTWLQSNLIENLYASIKDAKTVYKKLEIEYEKIKKSLN